MRPDSVQISKTPRMKLSFFEKRKIKETKIQETCDRRVVSQAK